LIALLLGVWNPGKGSLSQENVKNNACQTLSGTSCTQSASSITIKDFDANKNGNENDAGGIGAEPWTYAANCGPAATSGDNLATLCICYYNLNNDTMCKQTLCGCNI
jgi:hypothetical protein